MSRKKTKAGLLAALERAVQARHEDSGQGEASLAHVTCYRGFLVAKAMGEGGCTGYYWQIPEVAKQGDNSCFWAESFDDAFKDIDEVCQLRRFWSTRREGDPKPSMEEISSWREANPLDGDYADYESLDPRESGEDEYIQRNF